MVFARGYSLHDLLITLAIASILFTGGSGAARLIRETSQTAEINTFMTQLNLARTIAISRRHEVVVCPSNDGHRCSGPDEFTWWHAGLLTFVDENRNREIDTSDFVVQRHTPLDTRLRIKSSRHRSRVVYQPNGFSGGTNLVFTFCGKDAVRNQVPRYVVISNTGRARVSSKLVDGPADQMQETCT